MTRLAVPGPSTKTVQRQISCLFAVLLLAGCKAGEFSTFTSYTSPRISGRVVAANTQVALAGVRIRKNRPLAHRSSAETAKGSQLMEKDFVIRTDEQGNFLLEAESVLTPFRHQTWSSVELSFDHKGYAAYRTNCYVASRAEIASDGVPFVELGQIALRPAGPKSQK